MGSSCYDGYSLLILLRVVQDVVVAKVIPLNRGIESPRIWCACTHAS
jgi:hypothetical protein